jgi:hypothetical protein
VAASAAEKKIYVPVNSNQVLTTGLVVGEAQPHHLTTSAILLLPLESNLTFGLLYLTCQSCHYKVGSDLNTSYPLLNHSWGCGVGGLAYISSIWAFLNWQS